MPPRLATLLVLALVVAASAPAVAAPGDPDEDVVGWERGYWHDEAVAVDDPPSAAQRRAVTRRAMARVEEIRGVEFGGNVTVEVVERSSLDDGVANGSDGAANGSAATNRSNASEWNNQVWEALFVVGEDRDIAELLRSTTRSAIGGYYSHTDGGVRIVTDGEGGIDEKTVVHELVHAAQDQRFNLSTDRFDPQVQDRQLALRGLIEGEANYVQQRYVERCRRDWDCVRSTGGGSGEGPENMGVFVTMFQPYSDGPPYVHGLVERGGWSAVDDRFRSPPSQSETVIHRAEDADASVAFEDRSGEDWRLFPEQGIDGYDVAGEASVYAMLWYQSHRRLGEGLEVIDTAPFQRPEAGSYDTYDYTSEPSVGWADDRIYPYRNGDRRGYVWRSVWDTERDAREFVDAHRAIVEGQGGERVRAGVWRIPDGRFADAFRVSRSGRNVTVVNAPSVEALAAIRPPGAEGDGAPAEGDRSEGRDAPLALPWTALTVVAAIAVAVSRRVRRR